jgi:enhancing lycopene biosynthesis protein 2
MSHVAVVLSGCGFLDGAEITEAVSTLIALDQAGFSYDCFAPDRPQLHVVDHAKGVPTGESRNILAESARIARGKIAPLGEIQAERYSAIVFPGGFGAAKNLTNFAEKGKEASMYPDVKAAVMPFVHARKPLVAICASPLVLGLAAREAGYRGVQMTLGCGGEALSQAVEAWGQTHVAKPVETACVDETHHFISAPAYMYGEATPAQVFASVQSAIAALRQLLG